MKGFVKSVVSLSLVLGLACAAEAKTVLNLDFLSNEGTAEHASTLFLFFCSAWGRTGNEQS